MHAASRTPIPYYRLKIGNREIVGPSITGRNESYYDRPEYPFPPMRFRKPSPEMDALREKEKGSWKNLTIDEKKKLYRYSFCSTLSEVTAPRYEGRKILGGVLFLLSIPTLFYAIFRQTLLPPMPESFSDENKKKLVRFYIDSRAEPISGISTKWDYEKNQWKEKPYLFMKSK